MNVHVREGKVVKTSKIDADDPLDTRICQRGLTHAQRMYDPDRIQYPMRRVEGTERGSNEWERLTWDEAIDYITGKWNGYISEFGPTSIGICYGAGTYAYNQYVYMSLFHLLSGTTWGTGYDMASLEMGVKMVGRSIYLHGNDCQDVKNSKYIFSWGSNSTVAQLTRWAYIQEAVKNGAKRIDIDPVFTDAAEKADLWVPIRPGSDGALALAMTNVVIQDGLQDDDFLTKNTVAPFLVKADHAFLRMSDLGVEPTEGPVGANGKPTMVDPIAVCSEDGTIGPLDNASSPTIHGTFDAQGQSVTTAYDLLVAHVEEWTPEKASEVCDIPADTIVELAHMFAEGPTNLDMGFGHDHRSNGGSTTQCLLTLVMVSGQIGKTGTDIGGTMGQSSMGTHCVNMMNGLFVEGARGSRSISINYLPEIVATGMYGEEPMAVKSIFTFSGNTLTNMPGRTALEEAFEHVELLITADTVMTDTARYSDVILPVPHWFEYETFVTCPTPYADFNEKSVDPPFECKDDIEIASLLAKGLGLDSFDFDAESFHNRFLEGEASETWGLSWSSLKEKKHIQVCPIPFVFGDISSGFKYSTPSGRAEFYLEKPAPKCDYGQEFDPSVWYLPTFQKPTEAWYENPLMEKYPLNIITHRDRMKVHSQFATHPWLQEIQPEPSLFINPTDANPRKIAEGDYVKVYNDRGYVVLKARLDAGMRPGLVRTEHTWWDRQYVDGTFPSLLPLDTEHFVPAAHPFDTLCEVEKTTIN